RLTWEGQPGAVSVSRFTFRHPMSPLRCTCLPAQHATAADGGPSMPLIRRRAVLLGVIGVGVAGCSKPSSQLSVAPTAPPAPTLIPNATPSPSPSIDTRPRWPLTGKLLKDEGKARHAAVAVKVPDNRREHPQRGIDKADIVFVELEGYRDASGYSGTRLVPVFPPRLAPPGPPGRARPE